MAASVIVNIIPTRRHVAAKNVCVFSFLTTYSEQKGYHLLFWWFDQKIHKREMAFGIAISIFESTHFLHITTGVLLASIQQITDSSRLFLYFTSNQWSADMGTSIFILDTYLNTWILHRICRISKSTVHHGDCFLLCTYSSRTVSAEVDFIALLDAANP